MDVDGLEDELAREVEDLQDMATKGGGTVTAVHKRFHESAANRQPAKGEKGECVKCGKFCSWSEMEFDDDGNPICTKCMDAGQPQMNSAIEIPKVPDEFQKDVRGRKPTRSGREVIKVEDDDEFDETQAGPTTRSAISRPGQKRKREDSGQVVTIQDTEYLVYTDQDDKGQLVRLEEQSCKGVKSLAER
ncbi:uncharacterized protein A1O5_10557 [Cladophialophora psammophila CBS 110553]|uniref:Uncharacterized protein n=1 Tax=Cladophialophora psammophila CBS 110553 TaxID=1182543 RepID=W9WN39_9EURO|nr:uncharacterized protein A1O5_10557 [Cladophialophora psammophila CBS 110553]EXJ66405.1 hypothetical protein A1O5_10557 [Cladophialophora psammophila CBS 110553]